MLMQQKNLLISRNLAHVTSSATKVKFKQVGNHWKRVLEAAKLAYVNTTKDSITFQKLGSCDF